MLYFEVEGKGKSFVFLHGFLESHLIWNNLRKNLEKDAQIITIDLPGHGNSPVSDETTTMETMADAVIEANQGATDEEYYEAETAVEAEEAVEE